MRREGRRCADTGSTSPSENVCILRNKPIAPVLSSIHCILQGTQHGAVIKSLRQKQTCYKTSLRRFEGRLDGGQTQHPAPAPPTASSRLFNPSALRNQYEESAQPDGLCWAGPDPDSKVLQAVADAGTAVCRTRNCGYQFQPSRCCWGRTQHAGHYQTCSGSGWQNDGTRSVLR